MTSLSCIGALCALLGINANAAEPLKTWPILASTHQATCAWPSREAAIRVFDNEVHWRAVFPNGHEQAFKTAPIWKTQVAIAFTLGVKPTSGYSISLLTKQFERRNKALLLEFREQSPAAGDMNEQVQTQPCVFLLIERGEWQELMIRDPVSNETFRTLLPTESKQ